MRKDPRVAIRFLARLGVGCFVAKTSERASEGDGV